MAKGYQAVKIYEAALDGGQYTKLEKMLVTDSYRAHRLVADKNGRLLYTWHCIDNDCELCQLIVHANGSPYVIFRCDLYSYSVLNLDNDLDFSFFDPKRS